MDSAKNQLVDKLHSANNVLVTVSRDPSVDQLAACIGLTLLLNKLDKHATAVFSGAIPSTIEFLQPEETIEKNTDSLRDFIIALDKSKADKLRYKVEDQLVRIFITPYRTSINQDDLEFSQGDFNVDLVIALGVQKQEDLDQAITAHGRILHDATVASMNIASDGGLGSINWTDPQASSLSELTADLARALGQNLLDPQIATALLTGIVAQTERFSNERTTPQTMSVSSELMAAGANQQLVATKLEEPVAPPPPITHDDQPPEAPASPKADDGTLEIDHSSGESTPEPQEAETPEAPAPEAEKPDESSSANKPDELDNEAPEDLVLPPVKDSDEPLPPIIPLQTQAPATAPPELDAADKPAPEDEEDLPSTASRLITEPPKLGGTLTANSQPEQYDPSTDPLSSVTMPSGEGDFPGALGHSVPAPAPTPAPVATDAPPASLPATPPPPLSMEPAAVPATPSPTPSPTPILTGFTPPPPAWVPPSDDALNFDSTDHQATDPHETLSELEESVHSPHLQTPDVDEARDEVEKALSDAPAVSEEPIEALNAQPLGGPLHPEDAAPAPTIITPSSPVPGQPAQVSPLPTPANGVPDLPGVSAASFEEPPTQAAVTDPTAPPPVPPPIPYQFGATTPTEPPHAA